MTYRILEGDCAGVLAKLDAGSVQTCVTSPPYWGLRDYGTAAWEGGDEACDHKQGVARQDAGRANVDGFNGSSAADSDKGAMNYRDECGKCGARRIDSQLGLEPTPEEYVANLVAVFREVKRVLRDDGTLWLNLGDSYASNPASGGIGQQEGGDHQRTPDLGWRRPPGLKPKDLVGIPWMVAFALRADGWYLRSDIIWSKPNPMPESVTDRPTKAHEYLFLLTKSPRYFYDADAIREDAAIALDGRIQYNTPSTRKHPSERKDGAGLTSVGFGASAAGRNKRSVWTVATQPFPGAHFATFPPKLIEPCVLAGSPPKCCGECGAPWQRVVERTAMVVKPTPKREAWQAEDDHARTQTGGTMVEPPTSKTVGWESSCDHDDGSGTALVLDPFAGAGTTGVVALRHDRDFVGVELNPEYAQMARNRIYDDAPLLNVEATV